MKVWIFSRTVLKRCINKQPSKKQGGLVFGTGRLIYNKPTPQILTPNLRSKEASPFATGGSVRVNAPDKQPSQLVAH